MRRHTLTPRLTHMWCTGCLYSDMYCTVASTTGTGGQTQASLRGDLAETGTVISPPSVSQSVNVVTRGLGLGLTFL